MRPARFVSVGGRPGGRALIEQGYTVETAENGQEALALLTRNQPTAFDIVLLDVLMPELDGYKTLAQIKADATLAHVPVIVISAVDEMDSVVRWIEMGATDFLPKPFNAALLHARISASLAGKRLSRRGMSSRSTPT
jgi:adenylate cyclase